MKTLVKQIVINEGGDKTVYNGNFFMIEEYKKTEIILSKFLSDGWTLLSTSPMMNPAIQKQGVFSFYKHGSIYLFTKLVEDDVNDDGNELLRDAIHEAFDVGLDFDIDEEEEEYDIDEDDLYIDDEEYDYEIILDEE